MGVRLAVVSHFGDQYTPHTPHMIAYLNKRRLAALTLIAAVATSVACGEPNISSEKASPYVDKWSKTVEGTLREMAVAPAGKKNFKQRLQQAAAEQEAKVQREEPPFDVFVDDAYQKLDYEFQLVDRTGLTDRGQAIWTTIRHVGDHALDPDDYALDTIEAKLAKLEEANGRFEKLGNFETNADEKDAAQGWLVKQPVSTFELSEANYPKLTRQVLDSSSGQRMKDRLADYETVSSEIAGLEAHIEQLLARDVARYSRQMKHFRIRDVFVHPDNFDRYTNPNIEGRRPDKAEAVWHARVTWRQAAAITRKIAKKHKTDILYGRIRDTLDDVLTGDAEAALAALAPAHPQYAGLEKEYLRYKKIAADGGWPEVPVTRGLRKGRSGEVVQKLKKRLQIEGYYPADAPIDQSYDQALVDAVEAYQQTHQMAVTGKPHHMFWASINVPAARRVEQIALNMRRWRASNIRFSDPEFVYVNIPDFTAEVWTNQKRAMRFRVVVGNNDLAPKEKLEEARKHPEKKIKRHPNHTPTLSAYIDRVIYNPYWNVTDRIREGEILPDVKKSVVAAYKAKIKRLVGGPETAQAPADGADQETILADATAPDSQQDTASDAAEPSSALADSTQSGSDGSGGLQPADPQVGAGAAGDALLDSSAQPTPPAKPSRSAASYWSTNGDGQVVFDVAGLKKLLGGGATGSGPADGGGDGAGGEAKASPLAASFPYVDPASGTVDVSSTDPDHIPGWYEANNYEVMFPGKKWEYVRMKQGDENALGRVKVIFPNMYDVYLHDTPAKALFSRDIRAFSHGCMRMHKPLDFAEYLLKEDGQWDDYNVPHILKEGTYEPIFLKKQVPVHIDYITVRVDDNGKANFLADVYDKDKFGDDG